MPARHVVVGSAAFLACAALNSVLLICYSEELWKSGLNLMSSAKHVELIRPRVCILVTENRNATALASSLAATIEGDHSFSYGLFFPEDSGISADWFRRSFPVGAIMQSVRRVARNGSVAKALLFAAGIKGCSFFFVVHTGVRFHAPGWATAMVSALYGLDPSYYLGAVSPTGCPDCVFIHKVHRRIFLGQQHYPRDDCWAEWVRSVYGSCRIGTVGLSAINGDPRPCPPPHSAALESSGRLRVAKFTGSPVNCRRVNGAW